MNLAANKGGIYTNIKINCANIGIYNCHLESGNG